MTGFHKKTFLSLFKVLDEIFGILEVILSLGSAVLVGGVANTRYNAHKNVDLPEKRMVSFLFIILSQNPPTSSSVSS